MRGPPRVRRRLKGVMMPVRSTSSLVTFSGPFWIDASLSSLPAGTYRVETDEELIEGRSFVSYRWLFTTLRAVDACGRGSHGRIYAVTRQELKNALTNDAYLSGQPVQSLDCLGPFTPGLNPVDRGAVETAENEGMATGERRRALRS
jgi:hypothetical protein